MHRVHSFKGVKRFAFLLLSASDGLPHLQPDVGAPYLARLLKSLEEKCEHATDMRW